MDRVRQYLWEFESLREGGGESATNVALVG